MKAKKAIGKIPGVLYGLVVIGAFFAVLEPGFLGAYNLQNLLKDCSILIIISLGMNLVILTGRINISIGGVMSLTGVITAMLMQNHLMMGPAITPRLDDRISEFQRLGGYLRCHGHLLWCCARYIGWKYHFNRKP